MIGGDSAAARLRAARLGDGWFSGALDVRLADLKLTIASLAEKRAEYGRTDTFEITIQCIEPYELRWLDSVRALGLIDRVVFRVASLERALPSLDRLAGALGIAH